MLPETYARHAPRGFLTRIARATGLSYTTVHAVFRRGKRLKRIDKARAISDATAGQVSIGELMGAPGVDVRASEQEVMP